MKLRAIELTNVRRFAGRTVRVAGIGDGVSVLAAPNESGKSTLFDALQALLFDAHTSKAEHLRRLKPHQGDAPRVAAEIELDGVRFRLEKRWLHRPEARVLDARGALLAQADQAEAWIAKHLSGPVGGPAGLLWVRQGQAEFPRKDDPSVRRDILGQVAGEIDMLTGGRRMDAVMDRVAAEIGRLVTTRGAKAGGPLAAARAEVAALEATEAEQARSVRALTEALAERRRAEQRRAELDDPEAAADRARRLAAAEAAAEALRRHAERRAQAEQDLRLAIAAGETAAREREILRARSDERDAAERAAAQADAALAAAVEAARAARDRAAARQQAATEVRRALAVVTARAEAALRRRHAIAAAARAADLSDRLRRAEAALTVAARAEADRAAMPVTPARLEAARQAQAALVRLEAQIEAQAVTLRFAYDGPVRALRDGAAVEGPQHLTGPAAFDLPGIGRLTVEPGATGAADPARVLDRARAALARALADCGAATLSEAIAALARAEDLERTAQAARSEAAALAPDGPDALRRLLAEAQAQAAAPDPEPDPEPEPTLAEREAARRAAEAAEAAAAAAEAEAARARAAEAAARATAMAARDRLAAAVAALGAPEAHTAALTRAEAALAAAQADAAAARDRLAALDRAAPDAATVAAELARARGAVQAHDDERRALDRRLAELAGQIGALADQGIEEALAETRGRLAAARSALAAQEAELAALQRLRAALEGARAAARTAYFAPVVEELRPLLSLLHPEAGVAFDDATLLPAALERDGQSEGLEILSGGTREQVAVLTRLAFARLLARQGRSVPVILDDALVQTDDARIEAMFTALHRSAQAQQVIVLTCRQRAFAALGGHHLAFETVA